MNKETEKVLNELSEEIETHVNLDVPYEKSELIDMDYYKELAPLTEKIISIFKENELTFQECYTTMNLTYRILKYMSEQVNL